ncbi:MAG: hypothetical protein ACXW30_02100 [Micavibrio sp.]
MKELSPDQKRSIAQTAARTAAENGLAIRWLDDPACLNKAAGDGLLSLYQQIFAEPPYHESFTENEVFKSFTDTLKAGGLIFTVSLKDEFNKVSGFVSSLPLAAKKSVADHVGDILEVGKTAYFAEDGIAKELRRNGISGVMKRLLLESNRLAGYEQVLLRTSIESYPQISAVTKAGGRVIANVFQQVASPKQGGTVALDTRVFYLFTDKKNAPCDVLSRVTIIRPQQQDIALVRDQIPADRQADIARRIQTTYAGVKQVIFSDAPARSVNMLFDAKMYLPR